MKMNKMEFLREAKEDIMNLPQNVEVEVEKYLQDLMRNPFFGKKMERELKGCYSLYLCNATYRIVYTINQGIINVILIIAVGKRNDSEVYKIAYQRLQNM